MKKRIFFFLMSLCLIFTLPLSSKAAMVGDETDTKTDEEALPGDPGDGDTGEEDMYELTFDELDASYPHDAQLSINLYCDKNSKSLGYNSFQFQFVNDEGATYIADIRWSEVDLDSEGDIVKVSVPYLIPEGEYDIAYMITNPSADYTYFSYQDKVSVEKGQYYRLQGLIGSLEWIDAHKEDTSLIPATYYTMGDFIFPGNVVDALENPVEGAKYNIAPTGRNILIDNRYIKTWVHLTKEEKDAFINATADSDNASQAFADYCIKNDIPLMEGIDEYDHGQGIDKNAYEEKTAEDISTKDAIDVIAPAPAEKEDGMDKGKIAAGIILAGIVFGILFVFIRIKKRNQY